jgi:hypothetical protein
MSRFVNSEPAGRGRESTSKRPALAAAGHGRRGLLLVVVGRALLDLRLDCATWPSMDFLNSASLMLAAIAAERRGLRAGITVTLYSRIADYGITLTLYSGLRDYGDTLDYGGLRDYRDTLLNSHFLDYRDTLLNSHFLPSIATEDAGGIAQKSKRFLGIE